MWSEGEGVDGAVRAARKYHLAIRCGCWTLGNSLTGRPCSAVVVGPILLPIPVAGRDYLSLKVQPKHPRRPVAQNNPTAEDADPGEDRLR